MQSLKDKLRELRTSNAGIGNGTAANATVVEPAQARPYSGINTSNRLVIRTKRYPLHFGYGRESLEQVAKIDAHALSFMAGMNAFENLSAADLLFIDTETTGLAGGSGTYVFLIGIGRLCEEEFIVKQLLMNDFCHEDDLLEAFADELAGAQCLISFNGKSFDVPLLKTRFLLNRKDIDTLEQLKHVDLLLPARRLWKKLLPACTLAEVEAKILGYQRIDDLPSWAIPQVYFNYLRSQDFQSILPVLRHNVQDILSLAALAGFLGRVSKRETNLSHLDPLWMFRIYCRVGREQEALQLSADVPFFSNNNEGASARERLLLEKAFLLKRLNRYHESNALFEQLLNSRLNGKLACIELAKFYEHKAKDYRKALELMVQFEKRYEVRALIDGNVESCDYNDPEWEKRKLRLREKIKVCKEPFYFNEFKSKGK